MSVTRDPRSPFYRFDFQVGGCRFFGSTKATTRREAEKVEAAERDKAKAQVKQAGKARTSLRLDDVAGRYWTEVGQHHKGADNTERQLAYLIEFFGKDKLITEISGDDVTRLVAWRRGHRVRKSDKLSDLISPFTVNDLTEQLKKLFTRAKTWGVRFDHEPKWRDHWLDSRNLKLVQRAMGHADLKTTARYAHVLDDEIADAMEAADARKTADVLRRKAG